VNLLNTAAFLLSLLLSADLVVAIPSAASAQNDARCGNVPATIVGTADDDYLRGTSGRDVIVGLGGDDRILARGGSDLVCAGAGDDLVRGGPGRDFLYGSGGADELRGNAGRDWVNGGSGDDREIGGADGDLFGTVYCPNAFHCFVPTLSGADKLVGGRGTDAIDFDVAPTGVHVNLAKGFVNGVGKDFIRGIETVYGSQHPDVVIGNAQNNEIWAGYESRDDRLVGRGGDDRLVPDRRGAQLVGGKGDDVLEIGADAELRGGPGVDLINCRCYRSPIVVDLTAGTVDATTMVSGVENVRGGHGADTIIGNDQANVLMGRGGDDLIIGQAGDDILTGGARHDKLFGDEGDDFLDGGSGTNSNDGGEGTDTCVNPTTEEGALGCESEGEMLGVLTRWREHAAVPIALKFSRGPTMRPRIQADDILILGSSVGKVQRGRAAR
jgi:Ca2+-binding RTX toxin-like protein